jgi:predicted Zn-dependent peptidase
MYNKMIKSSGGMKLLKRLAPIELGRGVHLHVIKTDKFKTNLIRVYLQRPLEKEEVTKNALLTMVLPRGTERFTTSMAVSKELENLYGASLSSDVSKKGERNIIQFALQLANDKYLEEKGVFEKGLSILNEIIHKPHLQEGKFHTQYVEQEKDNLKERIEGRINDKMSYALDRCIEEMCSDEKFSLYEYGNVEDLKKISAESLYEHYQNIIGTSKVDIFVVGDMDEATVENMVRQHLNFVSGDKLFVEREEIQRSPADVKKVEDKMDVSQGKLTLGYRTNLPFESELYHPLVVFSNILGGGPNSKLFRNIREKESLCYYIFSRIEKFKSLMMISSGIEFDKYDKTVELVGKQLEEMKNGGFTTEDIESAKNSIITSMRSMTDTPSMMADFYYTQVVSNNPDSLDEMIDKVRKVTKEAIIASSKQIELDTIYFLRDKKEGR